MTATLLVTGATGFIAGTILPVTLATLKNEGIEVSARVLVRSQEKHDKVLKWAKAHGYGNVVPVIGDLNNEEFLVHEVATADYVIDSADADNLASAKSLLKGVEKAIGNGKRPLVLHTSGTNVLADNAHGYFKDHPKVDDAHPETIDALPETNPHRDVDVLLINHYRANKDKYDQVIVIPPTIWGIGLGPDRILSSQLPSSTRVALKHNQAYGLGDSTNTWTHINVIDLADLYALLLVKSIREPGKHGGFYFAENGNFQYKEVFQAIQDALYDAGYTSEKKFKTVQVEKGTYAKAFDAEFYKELLGNNSVARAIRGRELGWEPKRSSKEQFLTHAYDQVQLIARGLN